MRRLSFTLFCAALTLNLHSQILWSISGNGAKDQSFIFGTHHIAPYSITDSIAGFDDAINSVDAVIGEVNLANFDPMHVQQLTLNHAMAPVDSMLTKVLNPNQIDSLDRVLAKYSQGQLSAQRLDAMKPAMISTMLAVYQAMEVFPDFDQNKQLDGLIISIGKDLGKELDGFETIEDQLQFLFDAPIAIQAEQLMSAIRHDSEAAASIKNLAEAYMTQNLTKINEIMSAEMDDDSAFAKVLVTDRNTRWALKLNKILPKKSVFVVVGCGHLPGHNGLIELLRRQGYTINAVE